MSSTHASGSSSSTTRARPISVWSTLSNSTTHSGDSTDSFETGAATVGSMVANGPSPRSRTISLPRTPNLRILALAKGRSDMLKSTSSLVLHSVPTVSRSTARPSPGQERNYMVFPTSLDAGLKGHTPHSTEMLEHTLKTTPHMADQAINIRVVEALFYKQDKSPRHEFLIFLVRDKTNPNLENYISLDRNVTIAGSSSTIKLMSSISETTPADDYFRISNNRDADALQKSCIQTGHTCQLVEKITFGGIPFTLGQLVVLAGTTSRLHPHYTLEAYNCYWFASMMWDGILDLFSSSGLRSQEVSRLNKRGKIKNYTFDYRSQVGNVLARYQDNFQEFMANLRSRESTVPEEEEPLSPNKPQPPYNATDTSEGEGGTATGGVENLNA